MAGKLNGKVALVTGASSGIGEATALALAAEGAKVAMSARRAERLQKLAEQIGKDRALAITCDVSDKKQAAQSVAQTQQHFGRLDILVNNAGIMLLGPFDEVSIDDWEKMVRVNVLGVLYCTHAAVPFMKQQKSGHIVNISSVAGRISSPHGAVYSATKWALGGFGEGIRQHYAKNNIRVTTVEPGAVLTELTDHIPHEATKKMIKDWVGGMEALKSEDIANAVVYAVSQPDHVNINEVLIRPTVQER
jgi:NADP-dependent 3-hydroxy acid dehydrogenase YdfG